MYFCFTFKALMLIAFFTETRQKKNNAFFHSYNNSLCIVHWHNLCFVKFILSGGSSYTCSLKIEWVKTSIS